MTEIVGKHIIAEFCECNTLLLNNPRFIIYAMEDAILQSGANLIDDIKYHHFSPYGITAIALLSESHMSIHTYPEKRYAAVDIFTCGGAEPEKACEHLAYMLECKNKKIQIIERGLI